MEKLDQRKGTLLKWLIGSQNNFSNIAIAIFDFCLLLGMNLSLFFLLQQQQLAFLKAIALLFVSDFKSKKERQIYFDIRKAITIWGAIEKSPILISHHYKKNTIKGSHHTVRNKGDLNNDQNLNLSFIKLFQHTIHFGRYVDLIYFTNYF